MALNRNDLDAIRQYLLGALSEERQQEVEQRLLTEDDLYEELEVAEDELADEYVAGELSPAERERFEHYFLSVPERAQQLSFARALHQYASKKTDSADDPSAGPAGLTWLEGIRLAWARQSQLFRIAAAAAAIVIIAGALWFVVPHRPGQQSYATVTLTISHDNRAASAGATKVKLPLGADALRLYLKLSEASDPATRFRVELIRETGEKTNIERVARDGQSAVVELPAVQLARGQYAFNVYVVKSDGSEQRISGSYFLTVE